MACQEFQSQRRLHEAIVGMADKMGKQILNADGKTNWSSLRPSFYIVQGIEVAQET